MDPLYDALLGQLAVDEGLLTQDQLAECIRLRESTGRPLGAILLDKKYLTDESLDKLLKARAEASYRGVFPLEVRKQRTTEMFAAPPQAEGSSVEEKPPASEEIHEVQPVFPGMEAKVEREPTEELIAADQREEIESEFISDTPLPEALEAVPVAPFVDASRDVPAPPSEGATEQLAPSLTAFPDMSQDERSFGLLLVQCGLLNERRIHECLAAQKAIREHGIRLRLGEILVRKGIASPLAIRDILRLQGITLLHCPECLVNYNVLGYGHGKRVSCPRCETRLVIPVATAIDAVDTMILGHVAPTERSPAETFGRYLLFEEIGTGELGVSYKAWDTQSGRLVALKRLCPIDAAVGEDIERIAEGARTALGLRHASIAETYEVGDVEGDRYVAAKFVDGIAFSKLIRQASLAVEPPVQLTPRNIAEIARQVAEALSVAHRANVLHSDLKPSNIILDPNGTPHVTDFGIAIDRRPALGDKPDRWQRPVLGTFPYIAPEHALEEAPIGPAADVFSLGVILYEALTGKVPFAGETPDRVLYAIMKTDPDPPSKWTLNLPRDLERIVMKAIARDPGERYADGAALAADLARFVSGESLEDEEPMEIEPVEERPRPRPASKRVSERRALRASPAGEPLTSAEPPSRGRGKLVAVALVLALAGGGVWAWLGPVKNRFLREDGDAALAAGRLDVALEKYKELEARGVSDPELAAKCQECERLIAERKAAQAAAALKQVAHEALGQARAALAAARESLRLAVRDSAGARAAEGVAKAREAAELAEKASSNDPELVEALVVRVQALELAGDADAAREAADRFPAGDGRRAGAVPALVAVELGPLVAARGPLSEVVSPAAGVRAYTRRLPEPTHAPYRKRKKAVRDLLAQLTEPGDLVRPISAGVAAFLEGNGKTAAEELAKVVETMPEEFAFQLALAVARLGVGNGEGALAAADAALALRAADATALWARSAAIGLLGRPDAEDARNAAIRADRKLGHAQLDAAAALLAAGRAEEALSTAHEVLVERPDDPRGLLLSARARRALGQTEAALVEVDQALDAVPEFHAARVLRGELLAALGRTEEAEKELEGCVAKAPEDLEATLSFGRALIARRDPARAIAMLDRVVSEAAAWAVPLGARAEAKLLAKDLDGALADAVAALAIDAGQPQAVRVKALVRLAKGEGAMVEADLSAAIEKFPRDVELLKARARIRARTGSYDAAIYDLTSALAAAPGDSTVLLERARCYRLSGKPEEALQDLDSASSGGEPSVELLLERSLVREMTGDLAGALDEATLAVRTDGESAVAHAARARLLVASGQASVALQDAEQGVRLDPSCVEAWEARALVREALGQYAVAKDDIDQAIAFDGTLDRLYSTRARLRRLTGDASGAAQDEERCARAFRGTASRLLEDARGKAEEGDFVGAAALAARAAFADPGNVAAWRDRGFYRLKAGETEGALEDLDRALAIDRRNADLLSQRAAVKKALKDYAGAIADWTAALEIDDGRVEDRIARAGLYRSLGQKEKALEEVNAALSANPDAVEGLKLRAVLRNSMKEYAGAIEDARRAIELGGPDAWACYQLGYAYDASGKRQEAVEAFTQAILARDDYADAYSHRGWVQLALGNAALSRSDQLEALKHNPSHAWAHFRLAAVYASESAKGAASPLAGEGDLAALAIAELGKAIDSGFTSKRHLEATKYFEPIRNRPEYQELLTRLE